MCLWTVVNFYCHDVTLATYLCLYRAMTESVSEFSRLYSSLSKLGVISDLLLAVEDDSDNGSDIEALWIPRATNENIIELYNFMNRNLTCSHILHIVALDSVPAGRSMAPDRFSYHKVNPSVCAPS